MKKTFLFLLALLLNVSICSAYINKVNDLFPQNFTQNELDALKEGLPVLRNDYVFTVTEEEGKKLAKNYPSVVQVITGSSFSQRVNKTSETVIDDDYTARTKYIVQSAYHSSLNDIEGFEVKITRIIDSYLQLFPASYNFLNSTTLININSLDETFIRQTEGCSFKRITIMIGNLMLVLKEIEGENVFHLKDNTLSLFGRALLQNKLKSRFNKDILIDSETEIDVEDAITLADELKDEIFEKLGINAQDVPAAHQVQLFQMEKNWLESIGSISLLDRFKAKDPSLIKRKLITGL